jgi:hypothetical protein
MLIQQWLLCSLNWVYIRYGNRVTIAHQKWIKLKFLAFESKVSGKSHCDTPANFQVGVMPASRPRHGSP